MPFAVCMLKDRKGSQITTKCGRDKGVVIQDTTVWWRDVTCPKCLELMNHEPTPDPEPDRPRRKLVRLHRERRSGGS